MCILYENKLYSQSKSGQTKMILCENKLYSQSKSGLRGRGRTDGA